MLDFLYSKNDSINSHTNFDSTEAITFMHDMTLSKEEMRIMKQYMHCKGVFFPGTTKLLAERKKLKPEIKPLQYFLANPSDTLPGVAVDYKELVEMTTASIMDVLNLHMPGILKPDGQYRATFKDGADGTGTQTVMKSKKMLGMKENIYQHAIVPLRLEQIKGDGEVDMIWQNPAPNSAVWCRTQILIRKKEGACVEYAIPYTDKCRKELQEKPSTIVSFRNKGTAYQVEHIIHDTMKDLKLKKAISGLGGARLLALCA